jgi:hypothetical protein
MAMQAQEVGNLPMYRPAIIDGVGKTEKSWPVLTCDGQP